MIGSFQKIENKQTNLKDIGQQFIYLIGLQDIFIGSGCANSPPPNYERPTLL